MVKWLEKFEAKPMSDILFSFEKLRVYQHGRAIRTRAYKLARLLPKDEFKLKVQMRDAARSITNNIAEGHGRYGYKDRKRFLTDARGSLQEIVDDVNLCIDEHYAKTEHLIDLKNDALVLLKEINGYMKYLRNKAKTSLVARRSRRKILKVAAPTPLNHLTT